MEDIVFTCQPFIGFLWLRKKPEVFNTVCKHDRVWPRPASPSVCSYNPLPPSPCSRQVGLQASSVLPTCQGLSCLGAFAYVPSSSKLCLANSYLSCRSLRLYHFQRKIPFIFYFNITLIFPSSPSWP